MNTHKIASFEIIDHGIEHSQYFQGCGVSYTNFNEVATGCGQNATEALEDALEQIACGAQSVDLSAIEKSKDYKKAQTKKVQSFTVQKYLRKQGTLKRGQYLSDLRDPCELYYYVSVRYNLAMSDERLMRAAGLA